jgi:hypothetical protein
MNYWLERTRSKIAWIGTVSSIAVFIKIYDISWWWFLLLIPFMVILIFLDRRYIAPGEQEASTLINPQWHRLINLIEELKEPKESKELNK